MALSDYQQLVLDLVRDQDTVLDSDARDRAIGLALLRYSGDCERELTVDVTWPADGYLADLPAGWVTGAYLRSAEYPVGGQPPTLIEMAVYMEPAEQKLATEEALQAGEVVRVVFAAPHVLDADEDTIPAAHREAVASYAAQILCRQLASHFSGQRETTVGADSSNMDSRSRNYAMRAKEYRAAYYAGIGRVDPQADRAGGSVSTGAPAASMSSWGSRPRNNLTAGSLQ